MILADWVSSIGNWDLIICVAIVCATYCWTRKGAK